MNLSKRLVALSLAAIMLLSVVVIASAAMLTYQTGHNVTSDGKVKYKGYKAAGKHTEAVSVLEFNPKDGYIPVAFVGSPSSVATIPNQYTAAKNNYGYEVVGMINAGYFTMATSTIEGTVVTDRRIITATVGANTVVAFSPEGKMDIVTTQPKYTLTIGGKNYTNPIFYFNKDYNDAKAEYQSAYMFYSDYYRNAATAYGDKGVEVVFEKLDGTELAYGSALVGRVVKKNTSTTGGTTLAKNQFALYAKSGSNYAADLSALATGDKVNLNVTETNAGAIEVMNNCISALNQLDYLVKDGKNYTYEKTNLAGHSVTSTYARWTAYGVKADGTYVFLTSEGGSTGDSSRSLTLRNVADLLIELGCVTAVRLDGGGSTGMYLSNTGAGSAGWAMTGQRKVADTILVVKKSSMHDASLENELKSAIASAKQTAGSNASILKAIAEAESIIGTGATEGQLRKALSGLSPKAILGQALAKCDTIDIGEYTEPDLAVLRDVYKKAYAVYESESSTAAQYNAQTVKVYEALDCSTKVVVSTGAAYTATASDRTDAFKDDGSRLTDGGKGNSNLGVGYSGWGTSALSNKTLNVDLDLGASQKANTFTVYMGSGMWGISVPNVTLDIYTSTNGTSYTNKVATTTAKVSTGSNKIDGETHVTYTVTATLDKDIDARYVRFAIRNTSNFIWIDEVEVSRIQESKYGTVTNATKIQSFNTKISAGSTSIFTSDMGALTKSNANHIWSSNVICEKQSDGSYVVVENLSWHGDDDKTITLKSNQILICAHGDGSVSGSSANAAAVGAAQKGQVLHAYGIDIENRAIGVAAYVKFLNKGQTNPDLVEKEENTNPDPDPKPDPDPDPNPDVDSKFGLGDVNKSGEIDSMDYVLVKRAYFGTFTFDAEQLSLGDVNKSGDIDSMDYVLVKRAYFGTFSFQ